MVIKTNYGDLYAEQSGSKYTVRHRDLENLILSKPHIEVSYKFLLYDKGLAAVECHMKDGGTGLHSIKVGEVNQKENVEQPVTLAYKRAFDHAAIQILKCGRTVWSELDNSNGLLLSRQQDESTNDMDDTLSSAESKSNEKLRTVKKENAVKTQKEQEHSVPVPYIMKDDTVLKIGLFAGKTFSQVKSGPNFGLLLNWAKQTKANFTEGSEEQNQLTFFRNYVLPAKADTDESKTATQQTVHNPVPPVTSTAYSMTDDTILKIGLLAGKPFGVAKTDPNFALFLRWTRSAMINYGEGTEEQQQLEFLRKYSLKGGKKNESEKEAS